MTVLVASGLLLGIGPSAGADDEPVPRSCKPHTQQVVNPGCVPTLVDTVAPAHHTYPNLVPDVSEAFVQQRVTYDEATNTFTFGEYDFLFDTWAKNLGDVPVDLFADEPLGDGATRTVSQCVSWTSPYICRERQAAGGFTWHDEHEHFHFNDFASYQFRRLTSDGAIDYTDAGLLGLSDKVSFCLIDVELVQVEKLAVPTYQTCEDTRQGISPGWADVYVSSLPGQSFSLAGIPDGRYGLVIDMNLAGNVAESDSTDNRVEAIVDISRSSLTAPIVSKSWP